MVDSVVGHKPKTLVLEDLGDLLHGFGLFDFILVAYTNLFCKLNWSENIDSISIDVKTKMFPLIVVGSGQDIVYYHLKSLSF